MKTVKAEFWRFLDSMPERIISGWEMYSIMYARTKRRTYPPTLLKYAREYRDISGAGFECIDVRESRYHYTPGIKIAGGIE
jgi:hypothetical protein